MPKIPNDLKDTLVQRFLDSKNDTIASQDYVRLYTVVDTLYAARLFEPNHYRYENRDRLLRQITDSCIDTLDQVWNLIGPLPPHYRNEILRQASVRSLRSSELQKLREDSQAGRDFDPADAEYYAKLLQDCIQAFKMMMPSQFTELIEHQLKPFYMLMDSTAEFAKAHELKGIPTARRTRTGSEINHD